MHVGGGTDEEAPCVEYAGRGLVCGDRLLRTLGEFANGAPAPLNRVDQEPVSDPVEPMMRRELGAYPLQGSRELPRLGNSADSEVGADDAQIGLRPMIGIADPLSDGEPELRPLAGLPVLAVSGRRRQQALDGEGAELVITQAVGDVESLASRVHGPCMEVRVGSEGLGARGALSRRERECLLDPAIRDTVGRPPLPHP